MLHEIAGLIPTETQTSVQMEESGLVIHPSAQGCQAVSGQSLGKAGTQQPQAGAELAGKAPPTEERDLPFLFANRKGTF